MTPADQQLPLRHAPGKLDFSLVKKWEKESRTISDPKGPSPNIEYGTCMPSVCTKEELQVGLIGLESLLCRFEPSLGLYHASCFFFFFFAMML